MSNAKISYALTSAGQKASILAGGDGKQQQTVTVERDDPLFARVVARGSVGGDGSVSLILGWQHSFDGPQTAAAILDALDAADAKAKAAEAKAAEQRRARALETLSKRETRKHRDAVGVDRSGVQVAHTWRVSAFYEYETADWSYDADAAVKSSPEAVAWEAELAAARAASLEAALAEARGQLPALLAKEKAAAEEKAKKAEALAARKVAMGGTAEDYLCRVEDGAIQNVPCWQSHSRGKNWLATVTVSPSSPGGLARDFAAKARGDAYYLTPALSVGDAVEFGADYYSGSGRKSAERWYGFVVAVSDDAILFRLCGTGKDACKLGEKFVGKKVQADR